MIKFAYSLYGYGWAGAALEIADKKFEFEISYLCDPVHDLLKSLINIVPDYAYETFVDRKPIKNTSTRFTWLKEPGGYLWDLKLLDDQCLHLRILHSSVFFGNTESWKDGDPDDEIVIDTQCNLRELVKAVVVAFDGSIKEKGFLGYKYSWERDGHNPFPISDFLLLKYYILNGKGFALSEGEKWSLHDEIRLIQQEIK